MKRGRPVKSIFRLYDIATGAFVTEGTSKQCGDAIGVGPEVIRMAYKRVLDGTYKGYRIEEVLLNGAETDEDAIANWDAFVEPLRKEFGIPVYREKRERKQNGVHTVP